MAEDFRRDATDQLTFREMKLRDEDNLQLVMNKCKEKPFKNRMQATVWCNAVMGGIMSKFGINKDKIIAECLALPDDHFLVRQFVKQYDGPMPMPMKPQALYAAKRLYQEQLDKDVQIENRDNTYAPKDAWKSGVYIYHHNEIAYFLSAPYKRKGGYYASPHIIIPKLGENWLILTNWDDDAVKISK